MAHTFDVSVIIYYMDTEPKFICNFVTDITEIPNFTRYDLSIERTLVKQQVTYQVDDVTYQFNVPALNVEPKFLYTSCNFDCPEMRANWDKIDPNEFDFMICGGDQIYADDVFYDNDIKTSYNESDIYRFYVDLYNKYRTGRYATILATLPTINVLDDHDIFDGYGSYSEDIAELPIVKNISKMALKCYRLFQLGVFEDSAPIVRSYEVDTSVFYAIDHRTERTRKQLMSETSLNNLLALIEKNSRRYRKTFFLIGIPILFPHNTLMEHLIKIGERNRLVTKLLCEFGGVSVFGEFEGTDDIVYDSWNSHNREKEAFISAILSVESERYVLTGDSHSANITKYQDQRGSFIQFMSSGIGSKLDAATITAMTLGGEMEPSVTQLTPTIFDRNWLKFIMKREGHEAELHTEKGAIVKANGKTKSKTCLFC